MKILTFDTLEKGGRANKTKKIHCKAFFNSFQPKKKRKKQKTNKQYKAISNSLPLKMIIIKRKTKALQRIFEILATIINQALLTNNYKLYKQLSLSLSEGRLFPPGVHKSFGNVIARI